MLLRKKSFCLSPETNSAREACNSWSSEHQMNAAARVFRVERSSFQEKMRGGRPIYIYESRWERYRTNKEHSPIPQWLFVTFSSDQETRGIEYCSTTREVIFGFVYVTMACDSTVGRAVTVRQPAADRAICCVVPKYGALHAVFHLHLFIGSERWMSVRMRVAPALTLTPHPQMSHKQVREEGLQEIGWLPNRNQIMRL